MGHDFQASFILITTINGEIDKPCPSFSAIFMPTFEMLFKVSRLGESLSALFTGKRFVSSVCATVHSKTTGTQERFTAQAAEILLFATFLLGTLFFVVNKPNDQGNTLWPSFN